MGHSENRGSGGPTGISALCVKRSLTRDVIQNDDYLRDPVESRYENALIKTDGCCEVVVAGHDRDTDKTQSGYRIPAGQTGADGSVVGVCSGQPLR